MLRVGTFNILNTSCRYEERRPLIQDAIHRLNSDIIGLQEVNTSQINALQGSYEVYQSLLPSPMVKPTEPDFRIDGNCTLVNSEVCKVSNFSQYVYSSGLRIAQKLDIRIGNKDLEFVNTHLDHLSESVRTQQVKELLSWLEISQERNIVVVGDFNFKPDAEGYKLMSKHFTSAVKAFTRSEPLLTFPTGLYGEHSDIDHYGCLDYIWLKGNVQVKSAHVLWDIGEDTLFASDHYPIATDLIVNF